MDCVGLSTLLRTAAAARTVPVSCRCRPVRDCYSYAFCCAERSALLRGPAWVAMEKGAGWYWAKALLRGAAAARGSLVAMESGAGRCWARHAAVRSGCRAGHYR